MTYLAKRFDSGDYMVISPDREFVANDPRPVAHRKLREAGVSGIEADRILRTVVPDSVWSKAMIAAAVKKVSQPQ